MPPAPQLLPLTHLFTWFHKLGGVEAMLRRHLDHDRNHGIDSRVIAVFDPASPRTHLVSGAGCRWYSSPHAIQAACAPLFAARPAHVTAYHNGWGLPFLAAVDHAPRKIAVIHSDWPGLDAYLRLIAPLADGFLCAGKGVEHIVRRELGGFPSDRIRLLPYGIRPPSPALREREYNPEPFLIGVCGRVQREQKRVDRLPEFCAALARSGFPWRLEILGDGDDMDWLRSALSPYSMNCVFHGRKTDAEYWEALEAWDAILFVSDYEGLPISMLEAMHRGAIPIYPRIQSGGDVYVEEVDARLLYPAGDMAAAAAAARWLRFETPSRLQQLRQQGHSLASLHTGDVYERTFAEFVRQIASQPPIASQGRSPQGLGALTPVGLLARLKPGHPLRAGLL